MFKLSTPAKLALHLANLLVIAVILLPLAAVVIGSIQSEKSLQADTRRILPPEVTFDNFLLILSQGEQRGRIFEQATYLPDNIKKFYRAFANSLIVASSVTLLTLLFGALYALVIFAVGAAKQHLGEGALYGIAIVSGLTDMDAITLSIARMVDQNRIDPANGWHLILTASLSNLAFKAGVGVFLGGWRFGVRLLLAFGAGIAGGLLLLFLLP